MTLKRPPYDLRRRRDREAALLGVHLARGARVWWLAHEVWRQLAEPKACRAGRMARHAGVVGTGRAAVLGVLERFLAEVDAALAPMPRPRGGPRAVPGGPTMPPRWPGGGRWTRSSGGSSASWRASRRGPASRDPGRARPC